MTILAGESLLHYGNLQTQVTKNKICLSVHNHYDTEENVWQTNQGLSQSRFYLRVTYNTSTHNSKATGLLMTVSIKQAGCNSCPKKERTRNISGTITSYHMPISTPSTCQKQSQTHSICAERV